MLYLPLLLSFLPASMLPAVAVQQRLPRLPLPPLPLPAHGGVMIISSGQHKALRCGRPAMRAQDDGKTDDESWGSMDYEALQDHIAAHTSSVARLGKPSSVMQGIDQAWVLIFNVGQQDEGVYTLQGRAARASAYVLAFEYTDDANRFAQLLQAEGFDLATPLCWDRDQLATFCDAGQFEVSLVPQGTLITPPAKNEYDRDAFDKLDGPERFDAPTQDDPERRFPGDSSDLPDAFAQERMRLEDLFPQDPENCSDDDCTMP